MLTSPTNEKISDVCEQEAEIICSQNESSPKVDFSRPFNHGSESTENSTVTPDDDTSSENTSVACLNCGVRMPKLPRDTKPYHSTQFQQDLSPEHSVFSFSSSETAQSTSSGSQHICSQCASLTQSPIQEEPPDHNLAVKPDSGIPDANESPSTADSSETAQSWKLQRKHNSASSFPGMEQFLSMSMAYGMGHDVRMNENLNNNCPTTATTNPRIYANNTDRHMQTM